MKITVESPRIRLSEKLQKQIENKFSHLEKLSDRIVNCDVILKKEKNNKQKNFTVEARLLVPKELLFATEKAETFEIALDKVVDDMQQQLRRWKEEFEEVG
jgi:putative sigma-54 modulation protein